MSLIAWYPLDGNLNNYGCTGTNLTSSGTAIYENGKTGKAFVMGNNYAYAPVSIDTSKGFSLAFWFKYKGINAWSDPISLSPYDERFEISTSAMHFWYGDNNAHGILAHNTQIQNFIQDTWYHIAVCCDGSKTSIYINGVFLKSSNVVVNYTITKVTIGSRQNGGNRYNGDLNDVRIYDHALSPKEVKEISKGLVLHYPMTSPSELSINKYTGAYALGDAGGSFSALTIDADGTTYRKYTNTYTGTGSNNWWSIRWPGFSFTKGKRYYYSCKVRVHKNNTGFTMRAARCANDWSCRMHGMPAADGKWHVISCYADISATEDTFLRSGTDDKPKYAPCLEFYTGGRATKDTLYELDVDIAEVQVTESDELLPFAYSNYVDNIVYDTSGYGRDGTISGSIGWDTDSPVGQGGYKFVPESHILVPKGSFSGRQVNELTISGWAKVGAGWNSGFGVHVITLGSNDGIKMSLGKGNLLWTYMRDGGGGHPSVSSGGSPTEGTWYHCAATFKDGTLTEYIDGKKVVSTTTSSKVLDFAATSDNAYLINGYATNSEKGTGSICDVRVYATALSADDIAELYKNRASIANNGTMFAYDYVEEEKNIVSEPYINASSAKYGFETRTVSLLAGKTYRLTTSGHTTNSDTSLQTYIYRNNWSWSKNFGITSTSDVTSSITFISPGTEDVKITFYSFKSQQTPGSSVHVNWVSLTEVSSNSKIKDSGVISTIILDEKTKASIGGDFITAKEFYEY